MTEREEAVIPATYTHSIKLEQTAKGVRVSVHVYASDQKTAIDEVIGMYLHAREVAMEEKIPLAPIECKDNGK